MFVVRIPSDGNLPEISRRSYSASASSCQNALQIMGHAQFCIPKFVEICAEICANQIASKVLELF